jgi:septum formation protein
MSEALILASGSAIRAQVLEGAKVPFRVIKSDVDEDAIKRANPTLEPAKMATLLGMEKACEVSRDHPEALVLGADQTMELNGQLLDKLPQRALARDRLMSMRGKAHYLHAGLCLARGGEPVWQNEQTSTLYVRDFTPQFLDYYLENAGDELTASVGAYAYEGLGAQLFERVDGDFYAILGMPLNPLLEALRGFGIVET